MSEMVERVAKALKERLEREQFFSYDDAARIAIEAMREPLPEMIGAFWRQKNCGTQEIGQTGSETNDYAAWRAAIDAALSDNG